MKQKVLLVIAVLLVACGTIKTCVELYDYTRSPNYVPFAVNMVINVLFFWCPAVLLAAIEFFLKRKTRVLTVSAVVCGILAALTVAAEFFISGSAIDGVLYAVPAVISGIVCGIFAVVFGRRRAH